MTRVIRNTDALATNALRRDALAIAEAAYAAIDTDTVVRAALSLSGSTLTVGGRSYDLESFTRIRLLGFGKASCKAVRTIESVLKGRISGGVAIDIHPGVCETVAIEAGSHPHPSPQNVAASEKLVAMAKESGKDDLVLVVVSGGGSSLLCYPLDECQQGSRLYEDFKKTGASIEEMNTVRKHISQVKGGGLAAHLFPATVIGLVFSDIVGGKPGDVASGPTYLDETTVQDAQEILDRYNLSGYTLNETPKDAALFANVHNVEVVSNIRALEGMAAAARALGYTVVNAGTDLYDETAALAERLYRESGHKRAVIAGGEPALKVLRQGGKGGRCGYCALRALSRTDGRDVFIAFASDGRDNSDAAGAIVDAFTSGKAREKKLSVDDALASFDPYTFFETTGDLLMTGPTDANVSDLFILLHE